VKRARHFYCANETGSTVSLLTVLMKTLECHANVYFDKKYLATFEEGIVHIILRARKLFFAVYTSRNM
jgi:hypothetical protein